MVWWRWQRREKGNKRLWLGKVDSLLGLIDFQQEEEKERRTQWGLTGDPRTHTHTNMIELKAKSLIPRRRFLMTKALSWKVADYYVSTFQREGGFMVLKNQSAYVGSSAAACNFSTLPFSMQLEVEEWD